MALRKTLSETRFFARAAFTTNGLILFFLQRPQVFSSLQFLPLESGFCREIFGFRRAAVPGYCIFYNLFNVTL